MAAANWKNIGAISNIPIRGSRHLCLTFVGRPAAVFRTSENEIFALVDECPHKRGPLSEGIISGKTVTCPLHNWVIGLQDGKAELPDEGAVHALLIRLIDGNIYIDVPESVSGEAA